MKSIALLRGINVGGKNKLPMAELRSVCLQFGWDEVTTYIQSGNVIFKAEGEGAEQEDALEKLILRHFGLTIPVIVRDAARWNSYAPTNPFVDAAQTEPNRVMLCLSKLRPRPDAGEAIQERARDGEKVRLVGDALWIHYPTGAGPSRLSPALIDRLTGSPVTARNWRTALKIGEMLQD